MNPAGLTRLRALVEVDWLIGGRRTVLHHATLTDAQLEVLEEEGFVGPVRLSCRQTAGWVTVPGVLSRLAAPRCLRCCRARGLPRGVGAPRNDGECRVLLGLDRRTA